MISLWRDQIIMLAKGVVQKDQGGPIVVILLLCAAIAKLNPAFWQVKRIVAEAKVVLHDVQLWLPTIRRPRLS
jgi:hypothetical protein